jgi:hypothetical protein
MDVSDRALFFAPLAAKNIGAPRPRPTLALRYFAHIYELVRELFAAKRDPLGR